MKSLVVRESGEFRSGLPLGCRGVGIVWVLWGRQRFCWGRRIVHHSDGCQLHVLCGCKIFQLYLNGFLSFGGVKPASWCWWGRRNVLDLGGVVQSWMIGCCCRNITCVRCNVWKIVCQSVLRRLCYILDRLIFKHLRMKICLESASCVWVGFVWCCWFGMISWGQCVWMYWWCRMFLCLRRWRWPICNMKSVLTVGVLFQWCDWEWVIVQNVVNGGEFLYVLLLLKVIWI